VAYPVKINLAGGDCDRFGRRRPLEHSLSADQTGRSMEPIKTVLVSAAIVVAIVALMVGVMVAGELVTRWF